MRVHLIDGTYELFRHHFAMPPRTSAKGAEIGAVYGVVGSMLRLLEEGATHIAVATDTVIQSFRNELWPDYKTGEDTEPVLLEQFPLLETSLSALGMVVWPMVKYEADDGLASGAALAAADSRVTEVLICTPDKDLTQCVEGDRVVQLDRRKNQRVNREGVIEKFGVPPESITDYLALVGDTADGYPGIKGWGAKSTSLVLARYGKIEDIPSSAEDWDIKVRGAARLAQTLDADRELALLFRRVATVVRDAPTSPDVDALEWTGPTAAWDGVCEALKASAWKTRVQRLAEARAQN